MFGVHLGFVIKGLISRMLLRGFKVDFESVWVGLELVRARCAARFLQQLLGCFRDVVAQVWACLGGFRNAPQPIPKQPGNSITTL